MTIDAASHSADPWTVGMPHPLAVSVFHCDKATRRAIIQNWSALGERGRRECREYLAQTRLSWRRRERVRELIGRLRTPGDLRDLRPTTGA
jgi:uncharacterized protein with von Willebrand factor type A (vWA) domain